MTEWSVEPLDAAHDRAAFTCGEPALDNFLRTLASQYERRNLGRTFVAVRPGDRTVLGYYTLATGAIPLEHLPSPTKKLPRHPIPVVRLARLAANQSVRGQGLGAFLVAHALRRCLTVAGDVGIYGVAVDALHEEARRFWEHFGFVALLDSPLHLFMPLDTIRATFSATPGA